MIACEYGEFIMVRYEQTGNMRFDKSIRFTHARGEKCSNAYLFLDAQTRPSKR